MEILCSICWFFQSLRPRAQKQAGMYLKTPGVCFYDAFAIGAMYNVTKSILGTAVITAAIGVRQGSPTSCFLFNLFVDTLIVMLKQGCDKDGFLSWWHVLMLMDDTVIFATRRRKFEEKLNIFWEYCDTHGMLVNIDKTKFMVICGDDHGNLPIDMHNNHIQHCDGYVYLGTIFTSNGSLKSSFEKQTKEKEKHLHKLVMFLNTNRDFPFCVKSKVVEAAFNDAILYGCESWIGVSCQVVEKLYISAIKCLLGVRRTTVNDLCLIELGMSPLPGLVRQRQYNFLNKAISERRGEQQDPLMFAVYLTSLYNSKFSRHVDSILATSDHIGAAKSVLRHRLGVSNRSKFVTHRTINPSCDVHPVYLSKDVIFISEAYRMSFSWLRLSSHRLRNETGRWSRIPRDRRLYPCGLIQDEEHVLTHCAMTQHLRNDHRNQVVFPGILHSNSIDDFRLIHETLACFQ